MKRYRILMGVLIGFAGIFSILGSGTAPAAKKYTPLPFNAELYSALPSSGTGRIEGQVFAKTVGGDVKKGAGEKVYLIPDTAYGSQKYATEILGGATPESPPDSRYLEYQREKITDGDGKFNFVNVPPGSYIVYSSVTWDVVKAGYFGPIRNTQGGAVGERVLVKNGETTEAMLQPK